MSAYYRLLQKLFVIGILSFAFLLPILPRATGLYFTGLLILYLAEGHFLFKIARLWRNKNFWIFSSLFFLYLVGMIYSDDAQSGWWNIMLKSGLLFSPLFFFTNVKLKIPQLKKILLSFIIGCLFTSVFLLMHATYDAFLKGENNFSYYHLSLPLHLHPAYFSMYLIFCFIAIMLSLIKRGGTVFSSRIPGGFLTAFFLVMIYLLAARQQIIALFLIMIGYTVYYFIKEKKVILAISASIIIVFVFSAMVFIIPETKMRLEKMQEQFTQTYSEESPNSVTIRKAVWQSSWELLLRQPLIGYGTGDVKEILKEKYAQKNLTKPMEEMLNAHNQYLQTSLALGLPGLLALLFIFIRGIQLAVRKSDTLYVLFVVLIMISIITEAMFEAEMGIVFYTFFNGLLAARNTS